MSDKVNDSLKDLGNIILNNDKIIIAGHINPDGDAIGSCLALAMFLENLGKEVKVLLEDFNERYDIIRGAHLLYREETERLGKEDIFIALDCGDKKRLGPFQTVFDKIKTTMVIDHHISNNYYGDYNYVQADASSTCEIVYELLTGMGEITPLIAENLYAGIIFDTGGLRHKSTTARTMEIACDLVKMDIPFNEIYNEILFTKSMTEIKIFSKAVENISFVEQYPIAYTFVSSEMLEQTGATTKELDGIVEYLSSIRGIEVALFAYELKPGDIKLSFRSKNVNVSKLAQSLGGGGHINAAGASVKGCAGEVLPKIINDIKSEIDAYGN